MKDMFIIKEVMKHIVLTCTHCLLKVFNYIMVTTALFLKYQCLPIFLKIDAGNEMINKIEK